MNAPRRTFLKAAALASAGSIIGHLPPVSAEEARILPGTVRFRDDIEPLVRLLEETPRERLLEEVGQRIRAGLPCRDVVTSLLLAGIRNIQPRPVGFKFHAVMVVHSAYRASLNSPDADRWLPVFWALDQFKLGQERDVNEGDWKMPAVFESSVPPVDMAPGIFANAMDQWDVECADSAAAGLARGAGAQQVFDLMCYYGARDYRDIGHKAIYVASCWRCLQTMGWRHAEPVLRSLSYALLAYGGENPSKGDALADRPGRRNLERLKEIRAGWETGRVDLAVADSLLAALRQCTWDEASSRVVELLNQGYSPRVIWDALFEFAAELLVRAPGIVSLHASTATNALHYAFQHAAGEKTRKFLLLQNASFLVLFRNDSGVKNGDGLDGLDRLESLPQEVSGPEALAEIFSGLPGNRMDSARKALGWLQGGGNLAAFTDFAQRLVYLKGTDAHDYKFSGAVIEDYQHLSPVIRERFLAASVFWLKGSQEKDSPLVARTRAAL